MLIIRSNQSDTFDANARARFLDEVTGILHQARVDLGDEEAIAQIGPTTADRQDVELLAQKAESFGLRGHDSIGIFLQVAFFIGHDFYDVFRPASEVLRSAVLDEATKRTWLQKWYTSLLAQPTDKATD